MANNIIDTIQANLAYGTVHKVDPNLQEAKVQHDHASIQKLGQAAIPAVLAALYKFSRTKNGCEQLLHEDHADWLSALYSGKEFEAVEKVADYAGVSHNQAESHMENIADEGVKIVRENAGKEVSAEKVKLYMNSQRHNILVHLPAALNMGNVLNDESMDDRTNKMEGPISTFMHKIEGTLSDGDRKKGLF